MKACCGFGHRNVFENISSKLDNAVEEAIAQGCEIFYTGAMGDFDRLYSCAVRKAKVSYPHIKLVCVKPYFTNDINAITIAHTKNITKAYANLICQSLPQPVILRFSNFLYASRYHSALSPL